MEELWRNRASIHKKVHRLFISSGSTEANAQLDEVQQWLDDHPGHDGDIHLDGIFEAAEELVGVHEAEHLKGNVKSNKVLRRCDDIGEAILGNLTKRVTAELLSQADGLDKANKILEISKRLDPIRPRKASTDLEAHIWSIQEHALGKHIQVMDSALVEMKEPASLLSGVEHYVSAVSAAQTEAPSNLRVSELLLRRCEQLRQSLLDVLLSLEDNTIAKNIPHVVAKLDAVADGLAAVNGSSWEPRAATKVRFLMQAVAIKKITAHLLGLRDRVAQKCKGDEFIEMVREMEATLPWWEFVSSIPEVSDRLTSVHAEVDALMVKNMEDVAKVRDIAAIEVILKATQDYDNCRACFDGAETSTVRLKDKLLAVFSQTRKQVEELNAQLAESSGLNLGALESSLKTLVPALSTAAIVDTALLVKFSEVLGAVNARVQEMIAGIDGDIDRVSELMRWAERYDNLCQQLSGLEALGTGYLAQKLRPIVAAKIEEERRAEEIPTLPTSSFAPLPRDSLPPSDTKLLAGPEWGADSPRKL